MLIAIAVRGRPHHFKAGRYIIDAEPTLCIRCRTGLVGRKNRSPLNRIISKQIKLINTTINLFV